MMASPYELRISATPDELFRAAAFEFAARAASAVKSHGKFSVALSGGSTPKGLYSLLSTPEFSSVPWDKIGFFWGDERHVPPDHPDSNFRMVNEALLSKVSVRPENVFRIKAEQSDAAAVAVAYEQNIKTFFRLGHGEFPRFDLVLLGTGPDGHTASLFPGTAALEEKSRVFVANWVEKLNAHRFTLTLPAINQAACVAFLVAGPDKAPILAQLLQNKTDEFPAQKVHPVDGKLLWMVDQAAAGALKK